jgi:hypothetical protein
LRNNVASSSDSSQIELVNHLRRHCKNQNPHKPDLRNLTASSIRSPHYDLCSIPEYSKDNYWWWMNEPNQWLLFDLKGLSVKIEKILFDVYFELISRHWRLL